MRFTMTAALKPGMVLGRDIVSPLHSVILKQGAVLTNENILYLIQKGYLGAYVENEDTKGIAPEEHISQSTLSDGVKAVGNVDIKALMAAARQIVIDISNMKQLSIDLLDLRSYDEYTYRHSVNVAVYATAVAKYMGMTDAELIQMAQAGICHDLGKTKIPYEIINKPGRLTDAEFQEIKNHPRYSYDILFANKDISSMVRQAVLCHHENVNGSGYPAGKEGNELTTMAKILHAVDIYDALISKRPYKDPYTPAEAFEYMIGGRGILFDVDVVDAMKAVIPAYPIATDVRLSTGEDAVVIGHTREPLRPIVRVLGKNQDIDLTRSEFRNILITPISVLRAGRSGKVEKLNEDRSAVKERKTKIMLVDDSIISLRQTGAALENEDYELIVLQSGMAAINYIKAKGAVDLVIMDIEMPKMNGIAAVAAFREMGYTDMPVIFLTSNAFKETVKRCIEVNAKDYIVKPVLPVYLRERVAIALDATLER